MSKRQSELLQKRVTEAGWTLIEVIIVVTIILILTSAVGIAGMRYVDRAKVSAARNEISAFSVALDMYYLDCGAYPSEEQGLESLWSQPASPPVPEGWAGPYVSKEDFDDPWGNGYQYIVPGPDGLVFGLMSYGSDGREGGDNNDADIASWSE